MHNSNSGFPELFVGNFEFDRPYYLFEKSIDWQAGCTRLYVGNRRQELEPKDFATGVSKIAARIQKSPDRLDGVIFCTSKDWLVWWEHSETSVEGIFVFSELTDEVFAKTARRLRLPSDLTDPYSGFNLDARGDFINFEFSRI